MRTIIICGIAILICLFFYFKSDLQKRRHIQDLQNEVEQYELTIEKQIKVIENLNTENTIIQRKYETAYRANIGLHNQIAKLKNYSPSTYLTVPANYAVEQFDRATEPAID